MDLESFSIDQLNAVISDLETEKATLSERIREAAMVRKHKLSEEHTAEHGLTPAQYAAAKIVSKEEGVPLHQAVKKLRAQRVRAGVAEVQSQGESM